VPDAQKREFLSNSFEIARCQGCRLSETRLNPMTDLDLANRHIAFGVKGGGTHVTLLHDKLVPLFEQLQRAGRTATWSPPDDAGCRQWASTQWNRFFDAIGLRQRLPNACFHSLRVTAATAMISLVPWF
jgi:integrase